MTSNHSGMFLDIWFCLDGTLLSASCGTRFKQSQAWHQAIINILDRRECRGQALEGKTRLVTEIQKLDNKSYFCQMRNTVI